MTVRERRDFSKTDDAIIAMRGVEDEAKAYVDYMERAQDTNDPKLKATLEDVAKEELVHLGEFKQRADEAIGSVDAKVDEGEEEATEGVKKAGGEGYRDEGVYTGPKVDPNSTIRSREEQEALDNEWAERHALAEQARLESLHIPPNRDIYTPESIEALYTGQDKFVPGEALPVGETPADTEVPPAPPTEEPPAEEEATEPEHEEEIQQIQEPVERPYGPELFARALYRERTEDNVGHNQIENKVEGKPRISTYLDSSSMFERTKGKSLPSHYIHPAFKEAKAGSKDTLHVAPYSKKNKGRDAVDVDDDDTDAESDGIEYGKFPMSLTHQRDLVTFLYALDQLKKFEEAHHDEMDAKKIKSLFPNISRFTFRRTNDDGTPGEEYTQGLEDWFNDENNFLSTYIDLDTFDPAKFYLTTGYSDNMRAYKKAKSDYDERKKNHDAAVDSYNKAKKDHELSLAAYQNEKDRYDREMEAYPDLMDAYNNAFNEWISGKRPINKIPKRPKKPKMMLEHPGQFTMEMPPQFTEEDPSHHRGDYLFNNGIKEKIKTDAPDDTLGRYNWDSSLPLRTLRETGHDTPEWEEYLNEALTEKARKYRLSHTDDEYKQYVKDMDKAKSENTDEYQALIADIGDKYDREVEHYNKETSKYNKEALGTPTKDMKDSALEKAIKGFYNTMLLQGEGDVTPDDVATYLKKVYWDPRRKRNITQNIILRANDIGERLDKMLGDFGLVADKAELTRAGNEATQQYLVGKGPEYKKGIPTADDMIAASRVRSLAPRYAPVLDKDGKPVLDEAGQPKMEMIGMNYVPLDLLYVLKAIRSGFYNDDVRKLNTDLVKRTKKGDLGDIKIDWKSAWPGSKDGIKLRDAGLPYKHPIFDKLINDSITTMILSELLPQLLTEYENGGFDIYGGRGDMSTYEGAKGNKIYGASAAAGLSNFLLNKLTDAGYIGTLFGSKALQKYAHLPDMIGDDSIDLSKEENKGREKEYPSLLKEDMQQFLPNDEAAKIYNLAKKAYFTNDGIKEILRTEGDFSKSRFADKSYGAVDMNPILSMYLNPSVRHTMSLPEMVYRMSTGNVDGEIDPEQYAQAEEWLKKIKANISPKSNNTKDPNNQIDIEDVMQYLYGKMRGRRYNIYGKNGVRTGRYNTKAKYYESDGRGGTKEVIKNLQPIMDWEKYNPIEQGLINNLMPYHYRKALYGDIYSDLTSHRPELAGNNGFGGLFPTYYKYRKYLNDAGLTDDYIEAYKNGQVDPAEMLGKLWHIMPRRTPASNYLSENAGNYKTWVDEPQTTDDLVRMVIDSMGSYPAREYFRQRFNKLSDKAFLGDMRAGKPGDINKERAYVMDKYNDLEDTNHSINYTIDDLIPSVNRANELMARLTMLQSYPKSYKNINAANGKVTSEGEIEDADEDIERDEEITRIKEELESLQPDLDKYYDLRNSRISMNEIRDLIDEDFNIPLSNMVKTHNDQKKAMHDISPIDRTRMKGYNIGNILTSYFRPDYDIKKNNVSDLFLNPFSSLRHNRGPELETPFMRSLFSLTMPTDEKEYDQKVVGDTKERDDSEAFAVRSLLDMIAPGSPIFNEWPMDNPDYMHGQSMSSPPPLDELNNPKNKIFKKLRDEYVEPDGTFGLGGGSEPVRIEGVTSSDPDSEEPLSPDYPQRVREYGFHPQFDWEGWGIKPPYQSYFANWVGQMVNDKTDMDNPMAMANEIERLYTLYPERGMPREAYDPGNPFYYQIPTQEQLEQMIEAKQFARKWMDGIRGAYRNNVEPIGKSRSNRRDPFKSWLLRPVIKSVMITPRMRLF